MQKYEIAQSLAINYASEDLRNKRIIPSEYDSRVKFYEGKFQRENREKLIRKLNSFILISQESSKEPHLSLVKTIQKELESIERLRGHCLSVPVQEDKIMEDLNRQVIINLRHLLHKNPASYKELNEEYQFLKSQCSL